MGRVIESNIVVHFYYTVTSYTHSLPQAHITQTVILKYNFTVLTKIHN